MFRADHLELSSPFKWSEERSDMSTHEAPPVITAQDLQLLAAKLDTFAAALPTAELMALARVLQRAADPVAMAEVTGYGYVSYFTPISYLFLSGAAALGLGPPPG